MLSRYERMAVRGQNTTLLPFLYHTRTIHYRDPEQSRGQHPRRHFSESQRRTAQDTRSQSRQTTRTGQSNDQMQARPRRQPDIPFERPPPKKDPYGELELEGSTITPNERKAFEGLFNLRPKTGTTRESSVKTTVDAGANVATKNTTGVITTREQQRDRRRVEPIGNKPRDSIGQTSPIDIAETEETWSPDLSPALLALAKQARLKQSGMSTDKATKATSQEHPTSQTSMKSKPRLSEATQKELNTISKAVTSAQTDAEIWQILQTQVLKPAATQLEKFSSKHDSTASAIADLRASDNKGLVRLKQTLPLNLMNTFKHLQTHYRSSLLPLSIYPTIKRLGPVVTAAGASTALYTLHVREVWSRYGSSCLNDIVSVLKSALAEDKFDAETLGVIDDVLDYAGSARRGREGESLRVLWEMERTRGAVNELVRLKTEMVARLEDSALRAAFEMEAGRGEAVSAAESRL